MLPFAKDADARTELTFVKLGEPPLRIYKNEYDKPPASLLPEPCLVIMQDDTTGRYERLDEMIRTVKENGWDKEDQT